MSPAQRAPTNDPAFSVVICTRDRPRRLERTLHALDHQNDPVGEVVVVDQSERRDPALLRRAEEEPRLMLVRDEGVGLSRARNLGARKASSPWVAFVDDDCVPAADWGAELRAAIAAHPEAAFISGDVQGDGPATRDRVRASVSDVTEERLLRGRRTRPAELGLGVCMAVRRDWIERLGGFDERLGPGVPEFPAADDMDFNYRLLRAGGVAYVTPRLRATHEQWRSPEETRCLYRGYWRAWMGFSIKHLRGGDRRGGLWLLAVGLRDIPGVGWGAVRLRSPTRARVALAMFRGALEGIWLGSRRSWRNPEG